ncbi:MULTISPECIES: hypothetical protein [Pseudoalteromonas]|uniref:Uncharacterized protein n=1 Tax=Pseudoalteromonas byunsanensis TaxID=327939 RepID=A0A1S1N1T4_9GAMM|nr:MULTISPECIES: hypothetical protein [Pseudoalteromonas]OHU93414.1 hypothetical protein BIW53_18810 [Pseudoalteromonas byunsanensis]
MKNKKVNPLVSHFTIAFTVLAAIWMFVTDKEMLILGNSLVLIYIVCALASRMLKKSKSDKK